MVSMEDRLRPHIHLSETVLNNIIYRGNSEFVVKVCRLRPPTLHVIKIAYRTIFITTKMLLYWKYHSDNPPYSLNIE